jgi:homogentisate 1,2-dioxygenase
VHEGSGTFKSQFGNLPFRTGDYIVIPFGTIWQMQLSDECKFFTIENPSQIEPPKRYRNAYGQLLEHAPYCERDIRVPEELETHTERGEFDLRIKVRDRISRHVLDHHPFDVVGWDGYLYPWIFNIEDFEPITGRIHQPPPSHQTFEAHNFVVCSFVPRLFDYHPDGIPAPYNHSNIQSDEIIYYAEGNFMSRKGIDRSDISMHPFGLSHGPQPGMTEASIGKKETQELAVMVDTFHPLNLTKQAVEMEKTEYMSTWLEGDGE